MVDESGGELLEKESVKLASNRMENNTTKTSSRMERGHCNRSRDQSVVVENDDRGQLGENKGTQPKLKTTAKFLELHRRNKWENLVGWDGEDKHRIFTSSEMNPEDIQDYTCPMALIGSDVVSLYPNLDVAAISQRMREAILMSNIQWENVDYLEATKYIALNWDRERCMKSKLRHVLPRRRGRTGTRPGIKGAGPRGKTRGDQEQWIFDPNVVLTEEDKREIKAIVMSIVTEELFKNHFYSFGGATFHQQQGGPIGLRATCAVARVCMQIFDIKWKSILADMRIETWLIKRYMDDTRTCLPPIKPGWRIQDGSLCYSVKWECEDVEAGVTSTERTKRVLLQSMNMVEDYLSFTAETGEEFEGGWLPTLDMNLIVTSRNEILFKQYEKEVSSKQTIQRSSAMNENVKNQILSQDMIRRLMNTCENVGAETREQVVDQYAQKLINSGFSKEQTKRIVINGIRGFEGKRRRRAKEGRELRRTAAGSRCKRYREKLMGKTTWFKRGRKEEGSKMNPGKKRGEQVKDKKEEQVEYRTVLFVENSVGGSWPPD